ncbi:hypothetical protein [Streptomyces sp. NBC_01508]|uniref:hypothetical protein n=1 Tax=Streptomyces sp. NBC_01508 TaxID=2903888 RepID=UPI00386C1F51
MTSAPVSLQEALAELLADPDLLRELHENTAEFAARRGLREEDAQALAALRPQGVQVTAWVGGHKVRELIRSLYPASIAVADTLPQARPLLEYTPVGERLDSPAAVAALGRKLWDMARYGIGYEGGAAAQLRRLVTLRDLIHFETLRYEVAAGPAHSRAPATGTSPPVGPALRPGVLLAAFSCVVGDVRRHVLNTGELPDIGIGIDDRGGAGDGDGDGNGNGNTVAKRIHYVLAPGSGDRVRSSRIPPGLRDLLEACDGTLTPDALARRVGREVAEITPALERMRQRGFLDLPRPPGAE